MKFRKGQEVWIPKLKASGIIVKISGQKIEVALGTLTTLLREKDLSEKPVKSSPYDKYKVSPKHHSHIRPTHPRDRKGKIDLHGCTSEQAVQRLLQYIDDSIIKDRELIEVVHGIGEGKLKSAIHRCLAELSVIEKFKTDDVNPGVTWIYL